MNHTTGSVRNTYIILTLLNTLAASFIWGVNTIFLLDSGLTNTQAFAANAFFTFGQVLFEIPTGIVADTWGRRSSYIMGTVTLSISTLLYLLAWQIHAPFWVWAATSILLGLGFTFFSGATEAWLVDALTFTGFKGNLEKVFSKGQIANGIGMLAGSVSGGLIAQSAGLSVPYIIRAGVLGINCIIAFIYMKDLGFTPKRSTSVLLDMKETFNTSVNAGLRNPSVRWIMLAAPFGTGVSFYAFYAMQPYLLELYGDSKAYGIAGLAAAIVAGAQIIGGFAVPYIGKMFKRRTSLLLTGILFSSILLFGIGILPQFWIAVMLLVLWGLIFAAMYPVRQAYLNGLIPSRQRATVLSFDTLVGSSGGVVIQPILGRVADVWSYQYSYLGSAFIQVLAIPFILLARRTNPQSDIQAER